ncbi:MAG: hypothetical protein EOP52_05500 [Sphingobacteriales bacterium]|nr:MAG: hypothetical protein EOP52_05500 [Sphingobacteriales bacterium]
MPKRFFLFLVAVWVGCGFNGNAQALTQRNTYLYFWNALPEPAAVEPAEAEAAVPEAIFSFEASQTGTGNLLTWDVPQPESVLSVIIEGSEDGHHFTDLESLHDAEAGALDVFYDASPSGRRYYRLIANYPDGQQRSTATAWITAPVLFEVHPPSEGNPLTEVYSAERIEVYDLQGALLTQGNPVNGRYEFDLRGLPADWCLIRSGSSRQLIQLRN